MKRVKSVLGLCIVAVLGLSLGGCVVVPVPYRSGHYHYYGR